MTFRCEVCGTEGDFEDASIIARRKAAHGYPVVGDCEWFVGCAACSTEWVYWFDVDRAKTQEQVDEWVRHFTEKDWFEKTPGAKLSFFSALDRMIVLGHRADIEACKLPPGISIAIDMALHAAWLDGGGKRPMGMESAYRKVCLARAITNALVHGKRVKGERVKKP
jgi:hypothetical protein